MTDTSENESYRIAIHSKTKHPELWAAACRLGSVTALAKALGFQVSVVCSWVSLKSFPSYPHSPAKRQKLSDDLLAVVGKTIDELWPSGLRAAIGEGKAAAEVTHETEVATLLIAQRTTERLLGSRPDEIASANELEKLTSEKISSALNDLSYREREIITLRFGLSGNKPLTLGECGKVMRVGKERIRQIEARAIRKLQQLSSTKALAILVD